MTISVAEVPKYNLTVRNDGKSVTLSSGNSVTVNLSGIANANTGGAPTDAQYVTLSANGELSAERVLTGTSNQVTVTDGGAGSNVTLSTPQDIHTAATPTFGGLTDSSLTASRLVASDGSKAIASVSDLTTWIAGTADRVTVADDGDGSVTLSGPQDLATSSSPTFVGVTIATTLDLFSGTPLTALATGTADNDTIPTKGYVDDLGDIIKIGDTVTSGTAGSILFVGSGPVLAQANANLFWDDTANQLRVPTIVGGTATTSDLTLQTTSGVGTTGADMRFLVGNNGATEAMTILNSGLVNIASGKLSSPGVGTSEQFGLNATVNNTSSLAVGNGATASGAGSIAIGRGATATGGFAVGGFATQSGASSFSLGNSSVSTGSNSLAIGNDASAGHNGSVVIGREATSTAINQLVIGDDGSAPLRRIIEAYIGGGVIDTSPQGVVLTTSGGDGTNIAGGNLVIAGGKGSGNAAGGSVLIQTSDAGGSGTTLQTLTTKVTVLASGFTAVGGSHTPDTRLDIDAGALEMAEMTAPAAGASNTARIFCEDNGSGKTRLMVQFATGAAQQIAIEP